MFFDVVEFIINSQCTYVTIIHIARIKVLINRFLKNSKN